MHVWVDLTNSAHVVVLRPLVELLERDGHDVTLTARPLSHTTELLDDWGHPYTSIGHHGGARRLAKTLAASSRVAQALTFARGKRFDAGLAHASTDLPPVARLLRIPNTTMFDYEWASLQHHLNCRLATRVLVPDAIPAERLARYGAKPPKLVRYPGLKEEYYLADFEPDAAVPRALGLDLARVTVVVRTAPSYALYLGGSENELLTQLLWRLAGEAAQTVVLARTDEQRRAVRELSGGFFVPERALDARSVIAFADVVVSAGGTMLREAAVLGTPAWSIFEGRPGAVDEQLERAGRLRVLRDPAELTLEKAPPRPERIRRDAADLLRLALPWLRNS
jgi:predicted glycosyltransferase